MRKVIPQNAKLIPPQAKQVFKGVIFDVFQWDQKMYDGSAAIFERLRRADTVNAICLVDDKIIVIEDEQPDRGIKTKLPGGRVDPEDDSTLTAVQREVFEEIGYKFANWKLVDVVKPEDKIDWFVYNYIATDPITDGSGQATYRQVGEIITLKPKSLSELKQIVNNDRTGFLSKSRQLFSKASSLDDLVNMPEFKGKIVNV